VADRARRVLVARVLRQHPRGGGAVHGFGDADADPAARGGLARPPGGDSHAGEILPLPFLRYRFCELKYRGAVGRRQVHCTLIVKIIRFYCLNYLDFAKIESKSC
jgi:hypothetical protein